MPAKQRKLDALVARLQLEHGPRAIRRATPGEKTPAVPRIATGFAELDAALGGGLPRGRISEIGGPPTSGKVTLAAKTLASAHRQRDSLVAWIELSRTCDPDFMHRCGVALDRLLVVRPASLLDVLALAVHLVEANALEILVVDLTPADAGAAWGSQAGGSTRGAAPLREALSHLVNITSQTATAVLFLVDPNTRPQALAHAAAVRLSIRREKWLTRGRDVRGYEGQVEILKNRLGRPGVVVPIRVTINGTIKGDGSY